MDIYLLLRIYLRKIAAEQSFDVYLCLYRVFLCTLSIPWSSPMARPPPPTLEIGYTHSLWNWFKGLQLGLKRNSKRTCYKVALDCCLQFNAPSYSCFVYLNPLFVCWSSFSLFVSNSFMASKIVFVWAQVTT